MNIPTFANSNQSCTIIALRQKREVTSHRKHTAVWLTGLQDQFSSLTADVEPSTCRYRTALMQLLSHKRGGIHSPAKWILGFQEGNSSMKVLICYGIVAMD